ncbi:MAG TPA: T9SS type A sorting domain-containing protein, partial [Bacteroidota bacterium]|nr:T9SS type A sorting domain-containing protein [Bacteroidota bacterium]
SRSIDSSEYNVEPIIAEPNRFLYEAYLGRINVGASMTFDVFVDDSAVQVGTTTLKGDVNRTWYDGISYSLVGEKPSYIASTNIPGNVKLEQNFPNPFNPLTKICYSVKTASFVTLAVYDVLGREIKTLVNREQIPGQYSVEFDASSYASGVYFYTLRVNSELVATKKMLLIR